MTAPAAGTRIERGEQRERRDRRHVRLRADERAHSDALVVMNASTSTAPTKIASA